MAYQSEEQEKRGWEVGEEVSAGLEIADSHLICKLPKCRPSFRDGRRHFTSPRISNCIGSMLKDDQDHRYPEILGLVLWDSFVFVYHVHSKFS